MSTITVDPVSRVPELRSLTHVSTRRRVKNLIMTLAMGLSLVVVTAALLLVLVTVIGKGLSVVFTNFPGWFTQDISASNRRPGGGMRAAIVGTLVITAAATALAVPLGIGGAVYLNEYGTTSPFARLLRFLTNVMAGVPSIVMGLFIFVAWVLLIGKRGHQRVQRRLGLGVPDAPGCRALVRGDAEARSRSTSATRAMRSEGVGAAPR